MAESSSAVDAAAPMPADDKNLLAYGDNLDVLRRYVRPESVDLVYLDPPFNSNADYNVLYGQEDGTRAAAQIKAFKDTWRWDQAAVAAYGSVVEGGGAASRTLQAFRTILGTSNMLAYLAMMAPRLIELHKVLKPTGSIYLHCDPTASHYLKLLMDAVFGPANFQAEIIWKRTSSHNDPSRPGKIHDVLLFFSKSERKTWNKVYGPLDPAYVAKVYRGRDEHGQFRLGDLTGPGISHGVTGQLWRGIDPTSFGRHWRRPPDEMEEQLQKGRIRLKKNGVPSLNGWKLYLRESKGMPLQSIWTDIPNVTGISAEKMGYPTQKPVALLERIIAASSNPGDVVLDPFCGCGTAVVAAQRMERRWIGIDITHHATTLIKSRLNDEFGPAIGESIRVIGEPPTVEEAVVLAGEDPFQFQAWALGLVGARPVNGIKKGADRGIDGQLYFHESEGGITRQVLLSVKAGHTGPAHVRDLRGVIERENAEIGVLISLAEPTQAMRSEAADAGFYEFKGKQYPRVQLRTVAELLDGRGVEYPATAETVFKPTIWPPDSIPVVARPKRRRPKVAAAQAPMWPPGPPEPPLSESPAARRLREDYERRVAEERPEYPTSPEVPRSLPASKRGRSRQRP